MHCKNVLYAEDDENDVLIFKLALQRTTLPQCLHFVDDGLAAIEWLSGKGQYADREKFPIPDILILDLKMPKKSGFEVLNWVRNQSEFRNMPVIILSSSDEPSDVTRAHKSGATTYFAKTASFQDVIQYLHHTP